MPRGDRTGPAGMGSMTGRGAGYCAGYTMPGYANPVGGRGGAFRMGMGGGGGGRGHRNWYYATGLPRWARSGYPTAPAWPTPPAYQPPSSQQEVAMLRDQSELLKQQLDAIEKRIAELAQSE